jgi:hypothetical protein
MVAAVGFNFIHNADRYQQSVEARSRTRYRFVSLFFCILWKARPSFAEICALLSGPTAFALPATLSTFPFGYAGLTNSFAITKT